jgi:CBS domain-containing protein
MTCRDVMTANPSCCVPSDSVAKAAQIMKREDVGPVLIVSDYNSGNLVGIVTDRDLAVKVIAEDRDPRNTRIDEIMSHNPVTCRENDATDKALRLMSDHQVRRIPVVDSSNRLVGIIAQADLARHENEEEVGEMVEEISQPYGSGSWMTNSGSAGSYTQTNIDYTSPRTGNASVANSLAIGAVCLGVGAGLMYLFDPNRGRTRRAIARDKATSLYSASGEVVSRTAQDLRNRAAGVASNTKSMWKSEPVTDEKLVARVRSKMGRYVSHPHAVHVEANSGHVTVSGSILSHEAPKFLKCVKSIPGVQSVDDRLDVHGTAGSDPNLQGESTRTGENWDVMNKTWSPSTRVMASAVGGGLLLYGMKSRSRIGKATSALGLGLLTRGITNREMAEMKGMNSLRRLVRM